jgi:hypothetical protein
MGRFVKWDSWVGQGVNSLIGKAGQVFQVGHPHGPSGPGEPFQSKSGVRSERSFGQQVSHMGCVR